MPAIKMDGALSLLLRGVQTRRFHTVPMIQQETVGHHSALVAGMLHLIFPECSKAVLVHATFHDIAECETGDIPSPSKRLFVDRARMDDAEDTVMGNSGLFLPELKPEERKQLKVADILAGMATCLYERQLGNRHTRTAFSNFSLYYDEIGPHAITADAVYNQILNEWVVLP